MLARTRSLRTGRHGNGNYACQNSSPLLVFLVTLGREREREGRGDKSFCVFFRLAHGIQVSDVEVGRSVGQDAPNCDRIRDIGDVKKHTYAWMKSFSSYSPSPSSPLLFLATLVHVDGCLHKNSGWRWEWVCHCHLPSVMTLTLPVWVCAWRWRRRRCHRSWHTRTLLVWCIGFS